jgi:hypothetical protein
MGVVTPNAGQVGVHVAGGRLGRGRDVVDRITRWAGVGLTLAVVLVAGLTAKALTADDPGGSGTSSEPRSSTGPHNPPARICGNGSVLDSGPVRPPAEAVVVPAGDNASVDFSLPGKTYWFAPGIHTLGPGQYSQIGPADSSRFVGAPGAVLDGRKVNRYAFGGRAHSVVIEYLTIQNFGPEGDNNNEGVVNHDSGTNWTVRYNTIRRNAGAGLMIGAGNVVRSNCLTRNGQYGFNGYSASGPVDVILADNEISYNNTYDWEAKIEGCGCTGGGKFWSVEGAVVTGNYVHHNRGVGLWADNNNRGFLFARNYIADNDDVGLMYETSYNAAIRHNTIVRNGLVGGPRNPGFPTGGIYISESGADPRVRTAFRSALEIEHNLLEDNWAGIVLWENADRYCGSPANTSTGECTLVNPDVVTVDSCSPANIDKEPYYSDCRWKTQNVKIHDNVFAQSRASKRQDCDYLDGCGVMAVISNYGTYPDWSPYQGRTVQKAITFEQNNTFYDNTYRGAWGFMAFETGDVKTFAAWRDAPFRQDVGSSWPDGSG